MPAHRLAPPWFRVGPRLELCAKALLAGLGRWAARLVSYRIQAPGVFLFPLYSVGGAERVHSEITSCFGRERPIVIFTLRSQDATFLDAFRRNGRVVDLSVPMASRIVRFFLIGFIAEAINRSRVPLVFGSSSVAFYEIVPRLRAGIRVVDLVHASTAGYALFSVEAVRRLDYRIVVESQTPSDLARLYAERGLDPSLVDRVRLIHNFVTVPASVDKDVRHGRLKVLFVGRDAPEKRLHLFLQVAEQAGASGLACDFWCVGVTRPVPLPNVTSFGLVQDAAALEDLYRQAHLLVLTSEREGFPLVVMEAMANAVVPVCTDVGGLRDHVDHGRNGFLVPSGPESQIVADIVRILGWLEGDRAGLEAVARAARDYAVQHFSGERFCRQYRDLLLGPPESDVGAVRDAR